MAVFLFRQVFKKSLSCEYNRSGRKVTYYIGCSFFMNSIDKKTWYVYNIKYAKKTWRGGVFMKKDEILNASRKEHRNKDLAEMEVVYQAGSHASRVGAFAVIFCACSYYDLQSVGYILQHYCNTMVSSFYQNEAKE